MFIFVFILYACKVALHMLVILMNVDYGLPFDDFPLRLQVIYFECYLLCH
jgi:hypothetical protein